MTEKERDKIRTIIINIDHSLRIIDSITSMNALNYRSKQILSDIKERVEKDAIILQDIIASNWIQQRELDRVQKENEKEEDSYSNIIKFNSSYKL